MINFNNTELEICKHQGTCRYTKGPAQGNPSNSARPPIKTNSTHLKLVHTRIASLTFAVTMGSIQSIFAKTREATWNLSINKGNYYDHGRPFTSMLEDHHSYGEWLDVEAEYEVKLDKSTLHWKLLVKKKGSQTLPYISLEITTSNMTNILRTTRTYEVCKDNAIDKGVFQGRLSKLCNLADKIASKMDTYDVFFRNCQHFCNELLKELGMDSSPTTFSSVTMKENNDRTVVKDFDLLYKVLPETKKEERVTTINSGSTAKALVVKYSAKLQMPTCTCTSRQDTDTFELCKIPGSKAVVLTDDISWTAVSSKPSDKDLQAILSILAPLESKWREIGHKLALLPYTLNHNQGMCNMLKKYFEEPSRSWEQLANVVAEYSQDAAQDIIQLAREQVEGHNEMLLRVHNIT